MTTFPPSATLADMRPPTRLAGHCCPAALRLPVISFTLLSAVAVWGAAPPPPQPIPPLPSPNQIAWQQMRLSAFAHFGINTFYHQEWGKGTEDPNRFYPTNFDATQWVAVLKDAGFKQLILTCKHHDGFCLWPSAFTDHSVKSSGWYKEREKDRPGSGDVVKAVADACHHAGLKFGVYLSPWDRNSRHYGKGAAYNTYYENQLRELLTNYGRIDEVWWDGAKGDNTPQDYDFEAWAAIVHQLQPSAVIFQGNYQTADIRWVGNEEGHAPKTCWPAVDEQLRPTPEGSKWMPAETDVSIRPGWFYHASEDSRVKTGPELARIYKESVGRNSQLLLNVPPDKRGLITDFDIARLKEFKRWFDDTFRVDLARASVATASDVRGPGFEAANAVDDKPDTYWAASDQQTNAWLTVDLGAPKRFNLVELQEPISLGLRITGYTLDVWQDGKWKALATNQCIGDDALVSFPTLTASKLRLTITSGRASPAIRAFRVFDEEIR